MVSVAIFDYGAGNIFSLKNSLEKVGATVNVITNFDDPNTYSGLLLPGVGNFDPAMNSIRSFSKTQFQEYVGNMPVLGICLGMEMFFEKSEEGKEQGLNVIDGEVIILPSSMKDGASVIGVVRIEDHRLAASEIQYCVSDLIERRVGPDDLFELGVANSSRGVWA